MGDTGGPGDQGRKMGTGGQLLEMKPESCTTEAGPVPLRTEMKLKEHGGAKGSQQMEVR